MRQTQDSLVNIWLFCNTCHFFVEQSVYTFRLERVNEKDRNLHEHTKYTHIRSICKEFTSFSLVVHPFFFLDVPLLGKSQMLINPKGFSLRKICFCSLELYQYQIIEPFFSSFNQISCCWSIRLYSTPFSPASTFMRTDSDVQTRIDTQTH